MLRQKLFCAALIASIFAGSVGASAVEFDPEDESRAFAYPVVEQTNPRGVSMPPEFNWSMDEPIIRGQIVAGLTNLRRDETPGQAVMTSIATWLSNTLNIPAIYDPPRSERTPKTKLAEVHHGSQFTSQGGILSRYDDAKKIIYLPEDWSSKTPEGMSILIHEMVHHLQNVAGLQYACSQEREKLAYVAQERWLVSSGRSLEMDFGIDPLTVLLSTDCYIP